MQVKLEHENERPGTWSFVLFCLLISFVWAAPAFGAAKKSKVKAVEEDLKFIAGDEEGNESKALQAELIIGKSEDKAMNQLERLLKKYKNTPIEASLHFRLAEMYMRKAKSARFFEVHRDSEKVIGFMPQVTHSASSRRWVSKAVDTYDFIERHFTHYRDMDLVLFNNAFARQYLGQDQLSLGLYRRVIENFSQSQLVPDCHLALGEYFFGARKYKAALDEFTKIRQFPESRVYPYGIYKEAWSRYNLHDGEVALANLEEVVAFSRDANAAEAGTRIDLSREALQDMVLFYEDARSPAEAVRYFRKQGGDAQIGGLILKLGGLYQRHGKFQNLERVFSDLVDVVPMVAERPQIHRDLMEAFQMRKNQDSVLSQLVVLSGLCKEGSSWAKAQNPETQKECWSQLSFTSRHYAARWHKEFKKDPESKKLGEYAKGAYEAWLQFDHRGLEEERFRFSYAELLFHQGNYRAASVEYAKVGSVTRDLKMRHDGSYGAIVSLEKATGDKWSETDEGRFQELAKSYVALNPRGEFVMDVRFKQAFICYEKGRVDEAAPQLRSLALEYSSTGRGHKAAHLYLDVLNIKKDFLKLRDESRFFARNLKGLDEKTRAEFERIHEESAFALIQTYEKGAQFQNAADEYVKFAVDHRRSSLADKALYNAGELYQKIGNLESSALAYERLRQDSGSSPLAKDAMRALVGIYENQDRLSKASDLMLGLADGERNKHAVWLTAADFKALDGDRRGALELYQKIIRESPQSLEGQTALQRVAALHERNEEWGELERTWSQMASVGIQPLAGLAIVRLARHAFKAGNDEKAFSLSRKVLGHRQEKTVSRWAVAQARLIQAEVLEHEFDRASLKARPERLSVVLAIKVEKLGNAQKAFQDVIALRDQETAVEALVHLSKCYEKFASGVSEIQAPIAWPEAERKKFQAELENLAAPIEEKNVETMGQALKLAREVGEHDGTIGAVQNELIRLSHKSDRSAFKIDVNTPGNVIPVIN